MTGTVTINGVTYQVGISDLTPADVLPVFRTDTSILKTDSILLHAAGAQQNSAKKVLIPHLISLMSSAVAEDVVLTIEPYYDANGEYQGMYWHYNGQWLRRSDTGEMISVTDDAAEIALAAEQAVEATIAAKAATTAATNTESRVSAAEELRVQAENQRKSNEQQRQSQEQTRQNQESTRQQNEATRQSQEQTRQDQEGARAAAEQQRTSTFSDDHQTATQDHTRADDDHQTATQDHTRADGDHQTAGQDHTRADGDHQTAGQDHTRADADHDNALNATEGAEKVDAELDGMTVTITDRNGTSKSVDLSFDFYETYASVAAMNADLANIPKCAMVSIATDDPLDDENARVYQKRSDGTMKYICDLDQKSAEAWNDWLENKKPEIQQRIDTADDDHQTATQDHTRAADDHQTATQDHTRAAGDHQTATQDHTRADDMHAHQPYIADGTAGYPGDAGYFYSWDYTGQQYVRGPKLSLDWASMTQAERDALAADMLAAISFDSTPTEDSQNAITSGAVYAMETALERSISQKQDALVFASPATCESIIDEIVHVTAGD